MFTRHEDRLALLERKSPMQWAYAFANYKPAPTESLSMKSLRRFVTRRKD
jgi:hypothetical protein